MEKTEEDWESFLKAQGFEDRVRWKKIQAELHGRQLLLQYALLMHRQLLNDEEIRPQVGKAKSLIELLATDVFVEKAKYHLTDRAETFRKWGVYCASGAAIIVLFMLGYYIRLSAMKELIEESSGWMWAQVVVFIFRTSAMTALAGFFIYMAVSLANALFHESTILFNRRHSIRFGRLYVYLKFAGIKDDTELKEARKMLSVSELEQAFGWNIDTSTAFKDIRADYVMNSLLGSGLITSS